MHEKKIFALKITYYAWTIKNDNSSRLIFKTFN